MVFKAKNGLAAKKCTSSEENMKRCKKHLHVTGRSQVWGYLHTNKKVEEFSPQFRGEVALVPLIHSKRSCKSWRFIKKSILIYWIFLLLVFLSLTGMCRQWLFSHAFIPFVVGLSYYSISSVFIYVRDGPIHTVILTLIYLRRKLWVDSGSIH